jgi:hypothetical protein
LLNALSAARKAGAGDGRNQANALAEDVGPAQKRACEDGFVERIGPAKAYIN